MKSRIRTAVVGCIAVLLCWLPAQLKAENWPSWRGPAGTGISSEKGIPLRWSTTENVRWKIALSDGGNSTPIVWGDRVFVTQATEKNRRRTLMCLARRDGELLWQKGTFYKKKEQTHKTNPYCSPSPVTDGQRVICWFGSAGVFCYDLKGRQLWQRDLGELDHIWGFGSSPVIHGDSCFLNFGPGTNTFLIALDKHTGKTLWKKDIPHKIPSRGPKEKDGKPISPSQAWRGSWSTPLIIQASGHDELIVSFPDRLVAYNPADGEELWSSQGLGDLVYTSPISGDGLVVAMGGYKGPSLAVKPGGKGDVTESHRLWYNPSAPANRVRLGSGVIQDGYIYVNDKKGFAQCIDLKNGQEVWNEKLKGDGATQESWSSLVLCDNKVYAINKSGTTFVFRASPTYELLAVNSLDEYTNSSPVISNGQIFIRTHESLWCIAKNKK